MIEITGIGASSGIAIAKTYELVAPDLSFETTTIENPEKEVERLFSAIENTKAELEKIKAFTEKNLDAEKAEIFSAHLLMVEDPELINPMKDKILNDKVNAEAALTDISNMFIDMFKNMDNEYMKERAADIQDISKRILSHLLGRPLPNPSLIDEEVIVVAKDLTPSDTAQLNRKYVKAFVTDIGGRTSHSAILARSLEIPAVVGTGTITEEVKDGDLLIVDGEAGKIIVHPTEELVKQYEAKQQDYLKQKAEWAKLKDESSVTVDGVEVSLLANIGSPSDVEAVLENGAEGVGLYRTEFLYMEQAELPSEDVQFNAYKTVLEQMNGKPVTVRTLDIGGDKEVDYLQLPKEMNPFLGVRAIRYCLENEDVFRPQLRALLRASKYGNLKIMFPMVATLEEFRKAKEIFLEEKKNLLDEGIEVADNIDLGIMVEIPSTAIFADQFAKEVDFFSIGTNDLIQYTMAADRMNENISYLYQPYHPAILRLINNVIEAAHKEGKTVGMCGEMAGEKLAIPILLGLGLDEFSMSATSVLPARSLIHSLSKEKMASFKEQVLSLSTAEEVMNFVNEKMMK